jgi:hypothetical protein
LAAASAVAFSGVLMALGGWKNETNVLTRYYRTGAEHTRRGLALFAGASRPEHGEPPASPVGVRR